MFSQTITRYLWRMQSLDEALLKSLPYTPTAQQSELAMHLANYISKSTESEVFVLKGYAGTGKTTMVAALSDVLPQFNFKVVLLAPTGRAAKVLANYSSKQAFTIHKKIYKPTAVAGGGVKFLLGQNMHTNTVFIIDEASMIGHSNNEKSMFESNGLLYDLIEYVFSGTNCRLIFVGDTAQLPPVGNDESPALDKKFLSDLFNVSAVGVELTDVVRQKSESGILYNATTLRSTLGDKEAGIPTIITQNFKDVVRVEGYELQELIEESYSRHGVEGTALITRSNKRANAYNARIRAVIRQQYEELCGGDYLMAVKNNYFWLEPTSKAGFIANGDILRVEKVRGISEKYGFKFADVVVAMVDYPDEPTMEIKLLLSTLYTDGPALNYEQAGIFYQNILADHEHITNKRARMLEIKKSPYYNALQVKFAYAITCHKSQGGQWDHVYVEQGFNPEDVKGREFKRWLYTAMTRASEKLYLVNFSNDFFED